MDGRVCLFLMNYALQARLKILGHAEILSVEEHPELAAALIPAGQQSATEHLFRIRVEAYDWNCPQHITRRFTEAEVAKAIQLLQDRIRALEASWIHRKA